MTGRDWKRIETELGEVLPGGEADDRTTATQPPQSSVQRADEDSILKHIAAALGLDKDREP